MNELFAYLSNDAVADQSVFASPLQGGTVDADAVHHYTYMSQNQADVVPFSEPGPERPGDFRLVVISIRDIISSVDGASPATFYPRVA